MNQAEVFSVTLQRNQDFIIKATDGLAHSESVLQLPGDSNCMNWVLGHVAVYRDVMLAGISQTGFLTAAEVSLYTYDSKPVTANSKSSGLERLLKVLTTTHDDISTWLDRNSDGMDDATPLDLDMSYGPTVIENFAFLFWHESNHVGELHALRELALVNLGKGWK